MADDAKPPRQRRRELLIRCPTPPAEFKELGGSEIDEFNQGLASDALNTLWTARSDEEQQDQRYRAASAVLIGSKPRSELEGMLLAQMIACHAAAMECFRRAMLAEQGFEGREANLNAANKLSRTYAALLAGLDRHRGKGQPQVVRVERVTVEAGGQAIVGAVSQTGGGGAAGTEDRPHAQAAQRAAAALAHAPEPALRGADAGREPVPVAGGGREAALPDARRRRGQRRAAG
ncbi:MAG TPA: hypothetical protein VFY87_23195 [Geminicoccaceae bacterium]|nr:hypothetical protein [Geminicoccaceae bacterium]